MATKNNIKPRSNTSKKPSIWLRIALPLVIVLVWFGVSSVGGGYFSKISEVATNDQALFLPSSADSTKVNGELKKFQDRTSIPAIIVFEGKNDLSRDDFMKLRQLPSKLQDVQYVSDTVSPPIPSEDGKAAMVVVPISSDASKHLDEVFAGISKQVDSADTGLSHKIGGPASFSNDMINAFGAIDVTLLLVTLAVVFIILLFVYRSPVLPIVVLLTSVFALSGAILVVWNLADADILKINGQVQGILFILTIGAATDYALLYLARLREELVSTKSKYTATLNALKGSWEPVLAAGGTVIVALMCLLLSDLGSNRALGPVGGIGVAFAILGALTFLPSAMLLVGRSAFWPTRPKFDPNHKADDFQSQHRFWYKVSQLVRRRPRRIWTGATIALLIAAVGIFQLKASGVSQGEFILGHSDAREAQKVIDKHFAGGSGAPTYILASRSDYQSVAKKLKKLDGITTVNVLSDETPKGTVPALKEDATQSGKPANMPAVPIDQTGQSATKPIKQPGPTIHDDNVMLEVTLEYAADSDEAQALVPKMRQAAESVDVDSLVGGQAAVQYDTNQTSLRDRAVILPAILLAVTIILALLLRAIVAPILLLLTTLVSLGATLGISALVFNHLLGFPGGDPAVVLFGFVFLVALGTDYNIFLMTRVREETGKLGVTSGVMKALTVTGGVIISAGVVLAATFAALGILPVLFMVQIAFVVAFGVLLDTMIVRSLLVPALTLQVGNLMWWPSKLWRRTRQTSQDKSR